MIHYDVLVSAVESAFEVTGASLAEWPNPHEKSLPTYEAYSRLTNPDRWLLLDARVDTWIEALVQLEIATVDHRTVVEWEEPPGPTLYQIDRVTPRSVGALPLTLARSSIGGVSGAA